MAMLFHYEYVKDGDIHQIEASINVDYSKERVFEGVEDIGRYVTFFDVKDWTLDCATLAVNGGDGRVIGEEEFMAIPGIQAAVWEKANEWVGWND